MLRHLRALSTASDTRTPREDAESENANIRSRHALNRLAAVADFLDKDTGREVLGHGVDPSSL